MISTPPFSKELSSPSPCDEKGASFRPNAETPLLGVVKTKLNIALFGSGLVSAHWNGAVYQPSEGVGGLDRVLAESLRDLNRPETRVVFWNMECVPIHNGLDAFTHHPSCPDPRFEGILDFLGNRLLRPAEELAPGHLVLGGSGWELSLSEHGNIACLRHVSSHEHNPSHCPVRAVLNINGDGMDRYGFSPPPRIYEAAGASQGIENSAPPRSAVRPNHDTSFTKHRIVVIGRSITSSWGNGDATIYRGLIRELSRQGHDILFLERDTKWSTAHRDLPAPDYCRVELYRSLEELKTDYARDIADSSFVIVGSTVPEGTAVGEWALKTAHGAVAFYDLDTPVTLGLLHKQECPYLSAELIPKYDLYLSVAGGTSLSILEAVYGARKARALYGSVDPELYYPEATFRPRWDLGHLGSHSHDLQPGLERLLLAPARLWPQGRFVVAGPQYPDRDYWPTNTEHVEPIDPNEHRRFYNSQRFTLNLTKSEGYAPSVRLFEAAASGVPIISDWRQGLDSFFIPGDEILISHTPLQTLRLLKDTPDAERDAIATQARERVLKEHTAKHRADELLHLLSEAISSE